MQISIVKFQRILLKKEDKIKFKRILIDSNHISSLFLLALDMYLVLVISHQSIKDLVELLNCSSEVTYLHMMQYQ